MTRDVGVDSEIPEEEVSGLPGLLKLSSSSQVMQFLLLLLVLEAVGILDKVTTAAGGIC